MGKAQLKKWNLQTKGGHSIGGHLVEAKLGQQNLSILTSGKVDSILHTSHPVRAQVTYIPRSKTVGKSQRKRAT